MKYSIINLLAFIVLFACMCQLSHAGQTADIVGLWHINKESNDPTSWQNIGNIGNSTKWYITSDRNEISIIVYSTGMGAPTSSFPLPIKDLDFSNGRLQILTEEVWDNDYGVMYNKTYYDIYFDNTRNAARGNWRSEVSSGENAFLKNQDSGSLALRKLADKPPTSSGSNSLSIDRNTQQSTEPSLPRQRNQGSFSLQPDAKYQKAKCEANCTRSWTDCRKACSFGIPEQRSLCHGDCDIDRSHCKNNCL